MKHESAEKMVIFSFEDLWSTRLGGMSLCFSSKHLGHLGFRGFEGGSFHQKLHAARESQLVNSLDDASGYYFTSKLLRLQLCY